MLHRLSSPYRRLAATFEGFNFRTAFAEGDIDSSASKLIAAANYRCCLHICMVVCALSLGKRYETENFFIFVHPPTDSEERVVEFASFFF
jgi:hypothetical protein